MSETIRVRAIRDSYGFRGYQWKEGEETNVTREEFENASEMQHFKPLSAFPDPVDPRQTPKRPERPAGAPEPPEPEEPESPPEPKETPKVRRTRRGKGRGRAATTKQAAAPADKGDDSDA